MRLKPLELQPHHRELKTGRNLLAKKSLMITEGYLADFETEESSDEESSEDKEDNNKSDDMGLLKRTLKLSLNFQVFGFGKKSTQTLFFSLFLISIYSQVENLVYDAVTAALIELLQEE